MIDSILNELRTPVFLVNANDDVAYINSIGEEFFGHSANLIIGSSIYNLIPEDSPVSVLLKRVRKSKQGLTEESLNLYKQHHHSRLLKKLEDRKSVV